MAKTLEQITFETGATGILTDYKRGLVGLEDAVTELEKLKQETSGE